MTCIVGLVRDRTVYLGGDRAGANEYWQMTVQAVPKVFSLSLNIVTGGRTFEREARLAIGYTTSFRMGQLLRHHLEVPQWNGLIRDAEGWVVHDLIPAIRAVLDAGGYTKKEHNREEGGTLLVGFAGQLFRVGDDFGATRAIDGYNAIGHGGAIAVGALFAAPEDMPPEETIRLALRASEHHSAGVRAPFDVIAVE